MQWDPVNWFQQAFTDLVLGNLTYVVLGTFVLVLFAWAYEAYDEAEDRLEAAQGFGRNAASGTGGALNVVLVTAVAMVGWAATTFETAGEAVVFVIALLPDVPVLAASVFTIGLGALGLSDLVILRVWHFVGISAVVVVLAYAYRTDMRRVSLP